ncbi:MAG: hypothetical protein CV045_11750 [Cyanobacteria bacterium M5B4]|nr:MAG: hypothetical protein CV045_11750 [Cyanobacteria bacterium M5B4]
MLRKMEKLFRSYCFELKMLPDQIVENWCNKYYPDFALSVQHSWDYPGLFFYDFLLIIILVTIRLEDILYT